MAIRFSPLDQSDPAEIAGYQLRARLGSGGMGNVYLSFTRGGRPVALKVVRKEFADDPEFRRRFRMEVAAAQRVQGIYTAPVVDADPDAPVPWLATGYIAGPSLSYAVVEHGPLPEPSVYRLLAGVAEGLGAVHAAGIVHRDLKPANVLLAADGPRVIDFGIARAADATSLTGTGAVLGTPAFMTPEQVAGRPVSAATDIFALAHLVVYAATGHAVFGDGHYATLVYRIAQEEPDLSGCPESLREFAGRCLAKDPAQRPDLGEIMVFAKGGLAGQTMQLANGSWLPGPVAGTLAAYDTNAVPPPAPRSHQDTVTAGSLAAATVPGATGGGSLPPTRQQTAAPERPRRRGLRQPKVIVPAVLVVLLAAVGGGAYLGFNAKSGKSPQPQAGAGVGANPTVATSAAAASAPAGPASASASASASAPASALASPSGSGAAVAAPIAGSTTEYSTPEPFPLCDPTGGQWLLVNLTPQAGGCGPNMQAVTNSHGYSFGTLAAFPHNVPALSAGNTVTVSGEIANAMGPQCLGPAEGSSSGGYIGLLCNNGQWYIDAVDNLGTNSAVVGKQLATGSFPFNSSTTYVISLTFGSGTGKLGVTFSQGSASPLSETFSTGQFTPNAVGYALNDPYDNNAPATIAGFTYEVSS